MARSVMVEGCERSEPERVGPLHHRLSAAVPLHEQVRSAPRCAAMPGAWRACSSGRNGFTLVELLVSLLIFGMLAAAGIALLSFSVRAQEVADVRLDGLAAFRRANALLTGDLAQAAPRTVRDAGGAPLAAFTGGNGAGDGPLLAFVRRGWENVDEAPRPSLQRVEYSLAGGRLERRAFPWLDGAAPLAPTTLLDGVRAVRLRYRDRSGEWRDRWNPTAAGELPRAVELVIQAEETGRIRMLFLSGAVR